MGIHERVAIGPPLARPPGLGKRAILSCEQFSKTIHVARRESLRIGGLGLIGTTLPHWLEARAESARGDSNDKAPRPDPGFGKAKRCIFLFMWGGPAQQDTWDPKPAAPAEYRGEFRPIATKVPGLVICEHLPLLAQRADKLAVVRSVTHGDVNHTTATHELLTGAPYRAGTTHRQTNPHLGTVLARVGRPHGPLAAAVNLMPVDPVSDAPRFVEESHGQSAGWLGPLYDPMRLKDNPNQPDFRFGYFRLNDSLTAERIEDRRALLASVDAQARELDARIEVMALSEHYRHAYQLLASRDALRAFRLDEEPAAIRDRYGRNPHGQSVLLARRLIEADVPMVTVFWQNDGKKNVSVYWDTHNRNFKDLKTRLCPVTDQAFSALLDDLAARGLLDETLIVWTGEFGRTPRVGQSVVGGAGAGRDGRDHWPGVFSTVLAGAGIRGGTVYGASDRYAAQPARNPVRPADIVATIYHSMGIHPSITIRDSLDRPTTICDGKPIAEILAST